MNLIAQIQQLNRVFNTLETISVTGSVDADSYANSMKALKETTMQLVEIHNQNLQTQESETVTEITEEK